MNDNKFFVMINHPVKPVPLMLGEFPAYYSSIEKARIVVKDNGLADVYGYEIFELGRGEQ